MFLKFVLLMAMVSLVWSLGVLMCEPAHAAGADIAAEPRVAIVQLWMCKLPCNGWDQGQVNDPRIGPNSLVLVETSVPQTIISTPAELAKVPVGSFDAAPWPATFLGARFLTVVPDGYAWRGRVAEQGLGFLTFSAMSPMYHKPPVPAPEPGGVALLAGLALLCWLGRRR